jgi:predicted dehydrogenase
VLVEKPMALSLDETRRMMEAARASGKILMPDHNQRLIPTHLKARELLKNGAIGKPLFYQCSFKHAGPENWSINNTNSTWFFSRAQAHFGRVRRLELPHIDLIGFLTGMRLPT